MMLGEDEIADLSQARKRIQELERQLRWFESAHWLLANEEAFIYPQTGSVFFLQATIDPTKGCILALNMNDTFAWACADAEPFTYEQAEELKNISINEGWPGLVKWVSKIRGCEPIEPVKKSMEEYELRREQEHPQ